MQCLVNINKYMYCLFLKSIVFAYACSFMSFYFFERGHSITYELNIYICIYIYFNIIFNALNNVKT